MGAGAGGSADFSKGGRSALAGGARRGCFAPRWVHACSYTPAPTRLLLHACPYTPVLTRLFHALGVSSEQRAAEVARRREQVEREKQQALKLKLEEKDKKRVRGGGV